MTNTARLPFAILFLTTGISFAGIVSNTQGVVVDCDAGGSLAKALQVAEEGGPYRIEVRGTCHGSFSIDDTRVELRAQSRGGAAIVSPELETGLLITGGSLVSIRNLEVRGGSVGVRVTGHNARISILFSDVSTEGVAVWISDASQAFLNGVELHDSAVGLLVDAGSNATLYGSTSRDNSISGATVDEFSSLLVTESEIRGNGQIGLSAQRVSSINVYGSVLADNGEIHAHARDRSRLHIFTGSVVGAEDDPTEFALGVDDMSRLQVNDEIIVHGDVHGSDASYLSFGTVTVRGMVQLDGFSNVRIFNTEIDGTVFCRSGADATCDSGSTAATDGCPGAPPACGTKALGQASPDAPIGPRLNRLDEVLLTNCEPSAVGAECAIGRPRNRGHFTSAP